MYLPNTPRDGEEARIMGVTLDPANERSRDGEEAHARPDLSVATPAERARDAEERRQPCGH
jgi:hypothetical protein